MEHRTSTESAPASPLSRFTDHRCTASPLTPLNRLTASPHHRLTVSPIMSPTLKIALIILAGVAAGALVGYFGQCSSGTCPLTSTWWRGALYGGFIAALIAFGGRTG